MQSDAVQQQVIILYQCLLVVQLLRRTDLLLIVVLMEVLMLETLVKQCPGSPRRQARVSHLRTLLLGWSDHQRQSFRLFRFLSRRTNALIEMSQLQA